MAIYDTCMLKAQKISFLWRFILCVIFPPLAVFDKGCFSVGLVYLLTVAGLGTGVLFGLFFFSFLVGWIPAGLVALLICAASEKKDSESSANDVETFVQENTPPMQLSWRDILVLVVRYILCVFCPPLSVIDKGCGASLYVLLFCFCGWFPGTILAFLICLKSNNYYRK